MTKKYLEKKRKSRKRTDLTDNSLVRIVKTKDPDRYSELIDRYRGKLFAYLYCLVGQKDEVDDLLQNVFIKTYKNLNRFDQKRKFSSWIYRIAHNEAVNHIKRKYLKKFVSWEDVVTAKDKLEMSKLKDDAGGDWIRKERVKEVHDIVDRLPVKYKQVLILRYFSGKSYKEIADILGKPTNTVGTLINRAKNKLQEEVKNEEKKLGKNKKSLNLREVIFRK